jgi:glucose-1-phosphate adenylyltransferase
MRSVLFPGVHVGAGAVVEDSIVMHDARVAPGARLKRAIVDKQVSIGRGAVIGHSEGAARGNSDGAGQGLCVIGKGSVVPAGARIEPA